MKKYQGHAQVALGIFLGTVAGAQFGSWVFNEASLWAIIAVAVVGGIIGWIMADPMRMWRGVVNACEKVKTRSKAASLKVCAVFIWAASISYAIFFSGFYANTSMSISVTLELTLGISLMISVVIFMGDIFRGDELTLEESKDDLKFAFRCGNPIVWTFWMAYGIITFFVFSVKWLLLKAIPTLWKGLLSTPVGIVYVATGICKFVKRVVVYTFSSKALLSLIGSVLFAPIAFVYGSVLTWAVIGAIVGVLVYELISVRVFKVTSPKTL